MKMIDVTGQTFGRLTAIKFAYMDDKHQACWECACSCGGRAVLEGTRLRTGKVRSCGCITSELTTARNIKHGDSGTPTYNTWRGMKTRCTDASNKHYYGRGITMCEEWHTYENFVRDMGHAPKGTTLDRIDNAEGYSKENCRWATILEQRNNTRSNAYITYEGITLSRAEWARRMQIPYTMLRQRMSRCGWSVEKALTTPAEQGYKP